MRVKFHILLSILVCFPALTNAQKLYEVNVDQLDVLKSPDLNAPLYGKLNRHDIVEIITLQNGWATISFNNGTGYVEQKCITILEGDDDISSESQENYSGNVHNNLFERRKLEDLITPDIMVPLKYSNSFSLNNFFFAMKIGKKIKCKVKEDVMADGVLIIAKDTQVDGVITDVKKKGLRLKSLKVKFGSIQLADGTYVPFTFSYKLPFAETTN